MGISVLVFVRLTAFELKKNIKMRMMTALRGILKFSFYTYSRTWYIFSDSPLNMSGLNGICSFGCPFALEVSVIIVSVTHRN